MIKKLLLVALGLLASAIVAMEEPSLRSLKDWAIEADSVKICNIIQRTSYDIAIDGTTTIADLKHKVSALNGWAFSTMQLRPVISYGGSSSLLVADNRNVKEVMNSYHVKVFSVSILAKDLRFLSGAS